MMIESHFHLQRVTQRRENDRTAVEDTPIRKGIPSDEVHQETEHDRIDHRVHNPRGDVTHHQQGIVVVIVVVQSVMSFIWFCCARGEVSPRGALFGFVDGGPLCLLLLLLLLVVNILCCFCCRYVEVVHSCIFVQPAMKRYDHGALSLCLVLPLDVRSTRSCNSFVGTKSEESPFPSVCFCFVVGWSIRSILSGSPWMKTFGDVGRPLIHWLRCEERRRKKKSAWCTGREYAAESDGGENIQAQGSTVECWPVWVSFRSVVVFRRTTLVPCVSIGGPGSRTSELSGNDTLHAATYDTTCLVLLTASLTPLSSSPSVGHWHQSVSSFNSPPL